MQPPGAVQEKRKSLLNDLPKGEAVDIRTAIQKQLDDEFKPLLRSDVQGTLMPKACRSCCTRIKRSLRFIVCSPQVI
jgi:hypothetical protein